MKKSTPFEGEVKSTFDKLTATMPLYEREEFKVATEHVLQYPNMPTNIKCGFLYILSERPPGCRLGIAQMFMPVLKNIKESTTLRNTCFTLSRVSADQLKKIKKCAKYLIDTEDLLYLSNSIAKHPELTSRILQFLKTETNPSKQKELFSSNTEAVLKKFEVQQIHFEQKLLAHLFTFKGESQIGHANQGSLERFPMEKMHETLHPSIEQTYGANDPVTTAFAHCMNYENIDRLEKEGMLAIYGNVKDRPTNHAVGAVIFKLKQGNDYILARCDKVKHQPGIHFDKIGDPRAIEKWVHQFSQVPDISHFLNSEPLQLTKCDIKPIEQKHQKVDNCAVANYHSLERAILYITARNSGKSDSEAREWSKTMHQKRARSTALEHLDRYLLRFEDSQYRPLIDYTFIGKLFMKKPEREMGLYEQERLSRLERWIYKANLSPVELDKLYKGIKKAHLEGQEAYDNTGNYQQLQTALAILSRASTVLKMGKQKEAIAIFNKFIEIPDNAHAAKLESNFGNFYSSLLSDLCVSTLNDLDKCLLHFEDPQYRLQIDYTSIGKLLMEIPDQETSLSRLERLSHLERWIYNVDLSLEELYKLSEEIEKAHTVNDKQLEAITGFLRRALHIIKNEKQKEAIAILNKFIEIPDKAHAQELCFNLDKLFLSIL